MSPQARDQQEDQRRAAMRSMLYHTSCPAGRIFTGADAIDDALDGGWEDSPLPPDDVAVIDQASVEADEKIAQLEGQIEKDALAITASQEATEAAQAATVASEALTVAANEATEAAVAETAAAVKRAETAEAALAKATKAK